MGTVDINIRNCDEETRKRLNKLKIEYGEDNQHDILRDLIEFAERNEDQFRRDVIAVDRNRKHNP